MDRRFLFLSIWIFLLISGCSGTITNIHDERIADRLTNADVLNVPFIKQTRQKNCGISVLMSVFKYWGVENFQESIKPEYVPYRGYTLGELKKITQDHQLKAFAFQSNYNFLQKQILLGRPVIVPLNIEHSLGVFPDYNHYVIVIGFSIATSDVIVMDPRHGISILDQIKFQKSWMRNKNALLLISP